MYTSGGPTESRSLPDTRKSTHVDFDLRVAFAAERRLLPALLLIGLVATFAAMRAGANALALAWLALYGVNAAIRFLIATEYATAPREVSAETRGGKIYLATAGVDVVLWSLLLALVPNAAMFVAGPGAYAAPARCYSPRSATAAGRAYGPFTYWRGLVCSQSGRCVCKARCRHS